MAKVLGMGNALVDIMTRIDDDALLEALRLPKGSMQLVDTEMSIIVSHATAHFPRTMSSGGSAANTIHGLAKLGIETAFIGSVGADEIGVFFISDLANNNIKPILNQSNTPSGIAIALVSPDGERTFATHLGAAIELSAEHLQHHLFEGFDFFYVEGYLVQNEALLYKALEMAKSAGLIVALDLASYNVVEVKRDFLTEILEKYVDIVFANEEEAKSLTGLSPHEAVNHLAKSCSIAVVKIGENGSLIRSADEFSHVEANKAQAIDTTGAGDLYAAGFIFGLASGYPLDRCGKIGSLLAANVIEVIGAKMDQAHWNRLTALVEHTV
ncbi:MAG: adenosine kinase [Bacteroidales bacterium]|nr:adenosine kinase [Bacteroidales bacterium]